MSEVAEVTVMSGLVTEERTTPQPLAVTTADNLLAIAIQKGSSIEQLEQLFDLKLRVEADEARKAFVRAMTGFRSAAKTIHKNGTGHNNAKYATLDSITAAVNPILANNELSFCWSVEQADNKITVHCDVTHVAGHSQRTTLIAMPDTTGSKNAIQAVGSTVTYLQRYTLNAALGLATGVVDDDGAGSDEFPRITTDQAEEIEALLKETGYDRLRLLRIHGGAPSVGELHEISYGPVMHLLRSKKAASRKSTGVARILIDEQQTAVDPDLVASYTDQLKEAVFNQDAATIRQLSDEMDNDLTLVVHSKLTSEDRTFIRKSRESKDATE